MVCFQLIKASSSCFCNLLSSFSICKNSSLSLTYFSVNYFCKFSRRSCSIISRACFALCLLLRIPFALINFRYRSIFFCSWITTNYNNEYLWVFIFPLWEIGHFIFFAAEVFLPWIMLLMLSGVLHESEVSLGRGDGCFICDWLFVWYGEFALWQLKF